MYLNNIYFSIVTLWVNDILYYNAVMQLNMNLI